MKGLILLVIVVKISPKMNLHLLLQTKLSLYFFIILFVILFQSCSPTKSTGLSNSNWYINEENQLAIRFGNEIDSLQGIYVMTDKGVSDLKTFKSKWNGRKLIFKSEGKELKKIRGKLETSQNSFVLKRAFAKDIQFRMNELKPYPQAPYRYRDNIRTEIHKLETTYGKAPGYYTSLSIEDQLHVEYSQIILEVADNIRNSILKPDLDLKMDLYYPDSDPETKRPLVLLIHGGGFIAGDKADKLQVALAHDLARKGFVVASINYRMGFVFLPGAYTNLERAMYRSVQDARAALRFLSTRSTAFRIDPEQVFVGGNSAGGFISLMTAFLEQNEVWPSARGNLIKLQTDLGCLDCSANNETGTYTIKGIINLWGALPEIEMLDPYEKISLLLIHCNEDAVVPYDFNYPFANVSQRLSSFFTQKVNGSLPISRRASLFGIPAKLYTLTGEGHEPHINSDNILTPVYDSISTEISSFILDQLTPTMPLIEGPRYLFNDSQVSVYKASRSEYKQLFWECNGGLLLFDDNQNAKVVWFRGKNQHQIKVAGIGQNGQIGETIIEVILK